MKDTRKRWNHLLTLLLRRWPNLQGLRVFELHKEHGLHVHLLTNQFIDVNEARELAERAGWGRIHVKRVASEQAGYLAKVPFERASRVSEAVAIVGWFRSWLGVDEGKRRDSRDSVQPNLSSLQGVEAMARARWVLREDESCSSANDSNSRTRMGGWLGPCGLPYSAV